MAENEVISFDSSAPRKDHLSIGPRNQTQTHRSPETQATKTFLFLLQRPQNLICLQEVMVVVHASKINLPSFCKSLLIEPASLSLAVLHSDTSLSLFPSLPSPPIFSLPQMLSIPSPSSSHSFLLLQDDHHHLQRPRVLFIVGGPHKGGSNILLRFYLQRSDESKVFDRAKVFCKQKGLHFDDKVGVFLDANHGLKIRIAGSINFFALYSVSSSKIWIFGAKLVNDDRTEALKLMRCAVIDCCRPVFSLSLSSCFLVLGEESGLRVLNLRDLVKGKARKTKNSVSDVRPEAVSNCDVSEAPTSETACNCFLDETNKNHCASAKFVGRDFALKFVSKGANGPVKHILESGKGVVCFLGFSENDAQEVSSRKFPMMITKAVSIQALSQKSFLVLSSTGDLFMLHVSGTVGRSSITCHMRQLPYKQKVQKLASHPDISSKTQCVWVSDGSHSVHVMDIDTTLTENDSTETGPSQMQISVTQAIFAGEKIQDMAAISGRSILILGRASLYAYSIS